jgi:head-tail adaptor
VLFSRFRPGAPTVVRLRARAGTDSYGDPIEDWANADRLVLPAALVQDRTSVEEDASGRAVTRTEKVLLHPGDADVQATDRIAVDGQTYRVEGEPSVRLGLRGASHTIAVLRRVTG